MELEFTTKSEAIYAALKKAIFEGRYKPQDRIAISDIAKEFGISLSPVRDAIKRLEAESLIKFKPHTGGVVTHLQMEDVEKIYPIRMAIEGLAVRLAAQKINSETIADLEKQVQEMEDSLNQKKYEDLYKQNEKFHVTICSACENEYLDKIFSILLNFYYIIPRIFTLMPSIAEQALQGHKEILDALKKRDGAEAERIIIQHMGLTLSCLKNHYSNTD